MRKLLVATHNQGKFKEIKEFLQGLDYKLLSLGDLKIKDAVKEIGKTFAQNAIIKAKFYGRKSGLLTLASDAGLKVKVLGDRPGVRSRRYAEGSDKKRNKKLLRELKSVPWQKRKASFESVIALFNPKKNKLWTFKGECGGKITLTPQGNKGFGYDPIFWSREFKKTFGQLTRREKNKISHRGRALKKVQRFLKAQV